MTKILRAKNSIGSPRKPLDFLREYLPLRTYPPGPLSYKEKGERMAFLKVCLPGCFDGFTRMDHAIEPKKPLEQSLARPITVPPSSQAQA